jgi:hypothetical protein
MIYFIYCPSLKDTCEIAMLSMKKCSPTKPTSADIWWGNKVCNFSINRRNLFLDYWWQHFSLCHGFSKVYLSNSGIMIERPDPEEMKQNMCMDKGYDYPDIRDLVEEYGYTAHIRTRGEEIEKKANTRVSSKEMGCRKDAFMDESISKTSH